SRRRHTSFSRDWSSDVCSSDLHLRSALASLRCEASPRARLRHGTRDSRLQARAERPRRAFHPGESGTADGRGSPAARRSGTRGYERGDRAEEQLSQLSHEAERAPEVSPGPFLVSTPTRLPLLPRASPREVAAPRPP